MIAGLTDSEQYLIAEFRESHSGLRQAIESFCKLRAQACREACARNMAHVPRQPESAADYAAKAEVYDSFMRDLVGGTMT